MSNSKRRVPRTPQAPKLREPKGAAAGLEMGNTEIWGCVPADRDAQPVRVFGPFTPDVYALADGLARCQVTSGALESTGGDGIPIDEVLKARGMEGYVGNARHLKHVPGRKSDVQGCQWLEQLHRYGLLTASFRPADGLGQL